MYNYIIIETDLNLNTSRRRWRLRLPSAVEDYRQVRSFNSFFNSMWKLNHNGNYIYIARSEDEHNSTVQNLAKFGAEFSDQPIAEVDDIWDFYRIIGYDRSRRKYMVTK